MTDKPLFPPLDGSLSTITGFLDFHAKHQPDRPWVLLAPEQGADPSEVKRVSFQKYANASHRVAHAVRPGRAGPEGEVVAVIINCDTVHYLGLLAGVIRAGIVPFPMSPRIPAPGILHLIQKTNCHRIISQPGLEGLTNAVKSLGEEKQWNVRVDNLPDLQAVFPDLTSDTVADVEPYPNSKEPFNWKDVLLYMHSSGSTGFPKAIPHRNIDNLQWTRNSLFLDSRDRSTIWGVMPLPTFHSFGIQLQLLSPLMSGFPIGIYTAKAPAPPIVPSPKNILDACKAVGVTSLPMVPALLEAWSQSDDAIAYLASLESVGSSGGPLSAKAGEKLLAGGVKLIAVYGSTECGTFSNLFDIDYESDAADKKTKKDWEWMAFPDYVKRRWVPQGDGSYELQLLTSDEYGPSVENLPDVPGYATNDLFIPHPTKNWLWKITGRTDDVIVLSSGEKVVPLPQEGVLLASPFIAGVVMFGREKPQCGVLVEPRSGHGVDSNDPASLEQFRNKIWPAVEEANKRAPAYGRIFKEMILVTDPAMPLPRAAKGTVIRKQALASYANVIEKAYEAVQDSADAKGVAPPSTWSAEEVEEWLVNISASVNNGVKLSASRDVFDQGFDSLHATFLRNRILSALQSSLDTNVQHAVTQVSQNFVFENPTLHNLALTIAAVVADGSNAVKKDVTKEIQTMIDAYAHHLPSPHYATSTTPAGAAVVLLTGSTGNVGAHILATLLAEPKVKTVYTLNRPGKAGEDRLKAAFEDKGLDTTLLTNTKLVQLHGDVTQDGFGLDATVIDELKGNVTHILHNAWQLGFNLALPSFEKHIAGVRRFVDFACLTKQPVKLVFTSSVSSVTLWNPATSGSVPEELVTDASVAVATGYGASKFVAENILAKARANGIQCTSLRVGQVCGSTGAGAWGTNEWVPIMIKSSIALGMLPALDGLISWIPIDAVADAFHDLVVSSEPLPVVTNVVHPHPVPWSTVAEALKKQLDLPVVPYKQWLQAVETVSAQSKVEDFERVPAIQILEFFRQVDLGDESTPAELKSKVEAGGMALYETTKLRSLSSSVRDLDPISPSLSGKWLTYWKAKGFISV